VPSKDPYVVLGIEPGADPDEIKAAWRGLARRHHPDLTGDDPGSAGRATRRMAEINAAYAALTRAGETIEGRRARSTGAGRGTRGRDGPDRGTRAATGATRARGGPPPPPSTPPVTGRLDLSGTIHPRNQTVTPPGTTIPLTGQPPLRWDRVAPDLRASQPSGPMEIRRDPRFVPPTAPSLDEAV
jgi:hypothetical protein